MAVSVSRGLLRVVAHPLIIAWASTWRIDIVDGERWEASRSSDTPTVFLFWHEALLPLLWHHRNQNVSTVVSDSRDGQHIADLARTLGYRAVRGSSSKGATRVLLAAARELRDGYSVAFSPDGPRGPRRTMKPGALLAGQRSNATILPVHATAEKAWRLNSWDRFLIPKPFSRVRIFYGQPFTVGPGEQALATATATATRAMADLVSEGHGTTTP
jgi:lysophospholipid acyltransferase (LPLAT)-like uncharacterized protein